MRKGGRKYPVTRIRFFLENDHRVKEKTGRKPITLRMLKSAMQGAGYNVSETTISKQLRVGIQTMELALRYAESLYLAYGIDVPPHELIGFMSGEYSKYVSAMKSFGIPLSFQARKVTERNRWRDYI